GGYDEPEILPPQNPSVCLTGPDGEHTRSFVELKNNVLEFTSSDGRIYRCGENQTINNVLSWTCMYTKSGDTYIIELRSAVREPVTRTNYGFQGELKEIIKFTVIGGDCKFLIRERDWLAHRTDRMTGSWDKYSETSEGHS